MHWKSKSWILISVLLAAFTAAHAQIATTAVADTIHHADGTPATGTALISWPAFTTANGDVIPPGSTSATIAAGGALTVQLIPNTGAIPIGSYYTVVYHLDDGSISRQYWVVPASSSPVKISAIESTVLPTSVAMQTVSKSYVDTAIAAASTGHPLDSNPFALKSGDTMSGPLILPADPVSANQAADKNYVDESVAASTAQLAQKTSLGGDIGGTTSAAVVTGIQGMPVSATAPATGQALTWNGSAYVPTTPSSGGSFPSGTGLAASHAGVGAMATQADFNPFLAPYAGVPQYIGIGLNYPAIQQFGGNYQYAGTGLRCDEYTLPNDNGGASSSACAYIAYDNDDSPGWNYGNPTAPLASGWFNHSPFFVQGTISYSAGIKGAPGQYSGQYYSSGDFDGRRSYEIFKHAAIAPSDEGIVLDGDSPTEAGEGTYTLLSTSANGTSFQMTCTANCPSTGINHPLIDLSKATANTITAYAPSAITDVQIATVSTAVTPSVAGTLAANVLVPRITFFANATPLLAGDIVYDGLNQQVVTAPGTTAATGTPAWSATVGGTTTSGTVTFTNNGLQAALASQVLTATFNTTIDLSTLPTPLLCEVMQPPTGGNDGGYQEMIGPDAFGPIILGAYNSGAHTQSVTANWHYGHLAGSQFYCGGPVGEYIEYPQYTGGNNRYVQQIFGAAGANSILIGYQGGGAPFGTITVPNSWLPEAVNIYPGAEIYGINFAGPNYGVFTGANPNTWTVGDTVQSPNHISSSLIGNAFYESFNNPFARVIHNNVIWGGLGGAGTLGSGSGSASVGSAEYAWSNPNANTNYLGHYKSGTSGPQGIYNAPAFADLSGPVAYGMAFDRPPLAGGYAIHNQCVGFAICFAGAPDSGTVSQTGGIFNAYGAGTFDINYSTNAFEFTAAGGIKVNGATPCFPGTCNSTGPLTVTSSSTSGSLVTGLDNAFGGSNIFQINGIIPSSSNPGVGFAAYNANTSAWTTFLSASAINSGVVSLSLMDSIDNCQADHPGYLICLGPNAGVDAAGNYYGNLPSAFTSPVSITSNASTTLLSLSGSQPGQGVSISLNNTAGSKYQIGSQQGSQNWLTIYDITGGTSDASFGTFSGHPVIETSSNGILGFANGNAYEGTPDIGFSRDSAGVVDVGNGTAGDKSGTINAAQYLGPATAPTGPCPTNGAWAFSQDGHATFCAAGTWTTKL